MHVPTIPNTPAVALLSELLTGRPFVLQSFTLAERQLATATTLRPDADARQLQAASLLRYVIGRVAEHLPPSASIGGPA